MSSLIAHGDLAFHDPLAPERVDEMLVAAGLGPSDRLLDVGCGPGELLVRAAECCGCGGLGLDLSPEVIAAARARAAARAPAVDLAFEARDTRADPPAGQYDLVACLGAIHALAGGFDELCALARPGGWVLLADGFWRRPPSQAYLDALGATADDLPDYAGLVGRADASFVSVTSDDEWDRYEWTLIHNQLQWVAEHPEDPAAEAVAERARAARARYTGEGGRDTLGFALVLYRV
ncbi:MAG: hypothetical protein QOF76_831 [Solirubrobacteraceae bacterium]|jgi:SAM-dependent methyltransferase|nr:hypothetical protein [Solirubrobacteraceae bacterium]